MIRLSTIPILAVAFVMASATAFALPLSDGPQWHESGLNLVWHAKTVGPSPALTIGRARRKQLAALPGDISLTGLPGGAVFEDLTLPFAGNTPPDGGQYFCYLLEGNIAVPAQQFAPPTDSVVCSNHLPQLDNELMQSGETFWPLPPYGVLAANMTTFTVPTYDAGFIGSIVTLDGGPGAGWQPWFRNGDEVLFDMPSQAAQALPNEISSNLGSFSTTVDPGFYMASVTFTANGGCAPAGPGCVLVPPYAAVLQLPEIFTTGYSVEFQVANSAPIGNACPSAQINVWNNVDPTGVPTGPIGEITVGSIVPASGSETPRLATYRADVSQGFFSYPLNGIYVDMSTPPLAGVQTVTVTAVLHGYHDQLLK